MVKNSFLDRLKITKKGKILRRVAGVSHFLVKKKREKIKNKKKFKEIYKRILKYLH